MKANYLKLIKKAVEEDLGDKGDITTDSIIEKNTVGKAELWSKSRGIICGLEVFEDTFFYIDRELKIETFFRDGDEVLPGDKIVEIEGSLNSILKAERTALNFIQRMSGISTITNEYVSETHGTAAKILDTRKTLPAFRLLDKYAVKTGGGENHRMGLYDMFLIKDNHITTCGSISSAVKKAFDFRQKNGLKAKIEIEVKNIKEFKEALLTEADVIMLDNMDTEDIINCVENNNCKKEIEVSGNVTLGRIKELALTGVDLISSGSLTHSVRALDLSLIVENKGVQK